MKVEIFLEAVKEQLQVDFFTGVPDSQLKPLCDRLYHDYGTCGRHVIAANEGAAVGLAAGHYLATGKPALVYMQNSGIGNAANPIASLLNRAVYGIPCVFAVGWRGEPGVKDEPQHVFQGEITLQSLELLGLRCFVLSPETTGEELEGYLEECRPLLARGDSVAFVVKKGAFQTEQKAAYATKGRIKREDAIRELLLNASKEAMFVSTTGKTSRELFELREQLGQGHQTDFLTVGSMGHASSIALGLAMGQPQKQVWCIDGDGALLMHLGAMAAIAQSGCGNLLHIVINNGAHESVGGMPVAQGRLHFSQIAGALGYRGCVQVKTLEALRDALMDWEKEGGPYLLEVEAAQGSREDLGRPTSTPEENKQNLTAYLQAGCGQ